jgi:hypothetical protein
LMKRPELMDASTRRFVEALLSPPPRDNWTRNHSPANSNDKR